MSTLSNRPSAAPLAALLLALALVPGAARAATLVVDVDGTYDAGTTTCSGSDAAFTTIQAAVTASTTSDTILVCPGTYNETQIIINKGLTVQSVAGAASTIIDGGGGTGLALAGTVVINATTGNVLFDGFTVRNAKAGPSSVRFNVRVGANANVTFTVTHNVLEGTNNPADGSDYGLYAAGPNANDTLVFHNNQLLNHGSNTILIERHKGPTDVSYNTFTRGVRSGTISAYINMSHSGDAITTLQKVSHNTIDMANDPGPYTAANQSTAIVFRGALVGTSLGTFSNVEISHNTITNLRAFRSGIALANTANTLANQALGVISNAVISCNSMTWVGPAETSSRGVLLQGYVTNPTITGNTIDGVDVGFRAQPVNGHIADTATFQQNSVANTVTAAADWQPTGALAAESNWWGSATGPTNPGNPGGTGGIIVGTGPVDFTPWLTSGGDADPGPCFVAGCGNGTTNPGEDCDEGGLNGAATSCCSTICTFRPAGEECRPDSGICDVADTCTGASGACPTDAAEIAGTPCRASAGICDLPETCDGSSTTCPADAVASAMTICRAADGPCDIAETCDGTNTACPADAIEPAGTTCRAAGGVCDLAETCDGVGTACPADIKSTAVCRASVGVCDVAEACNGVNDDCPANGFEPATTICRPSVDACDLDELCTGSGAGCPADTGLPDTDTDTVCDAIDNCDTIVNTDQANNDSDTFGDACDPCTNIVPTLPSKTKLILTKLLAPATDDRLNFRGFFTAMPNTPTVDPIANGLRVLISDSLGNTPVDVTIPGGAYNPSTRIGWKVNGSGTSWKYKNSTTPVNGLYKAQLKAYPSTPGKYKFAVKGKNGNYAVNTVNLPLKGTIVIDVPYAATGQCGETAFQTPPTKPNCAVAAGGKTVKCK